METKGTSLVSEIEIKIPRKLLKQAFKSKRNLQKLTKQIRKEIKRKERDFKRLKER